MIKISMRRLNCMLITCLSLFLFIVATSGEFSAKKYPNNNTKKKNSNNGVYIVYMGAAAETNEVHAELVASLAERDALVHSYTSGFSGFAAHLTEEEARSIARRPAVVSVFPDPVLQLHTTRSWDFLESFSLQPPQSPILSSSPSSTTSSPSPDTIIGFLDTGIWPESPSFNDHGMGPIPPRWKGMCQDGYDFNASLSCNKKIIGARHYAKSRRVPWRRGTPRDHLGHGTHVASTAAGSPVEGASYYGVAPGTARGGSPSSRIAMYRVCDGKYGICMGSDILKGFDDAIKDGVDVLSVSLGSGPDGGMKPDFVKDPVAFGSFHAVERGIVVVCSAGNSGPYPASVDNEAPWVLSVAASTLDRRFQSPIVLGRSNEVIIQGGGIHFGKLRKRAAYGLVTGAMARKKNASESNARVCFPGSLDAAKVRGRIVVCEEDYSLEAGAAEVVKSLGGVGVIQIVDKDELFIAPQYDVLSGSAVSPPQASQIFTYLNSTKDPVATILPTGTVIGYEPAPVVIYFSSRGPARASANILKPDITAPGVDILAAWPSPGGGKKLPGYNIISGTSMSCPHASGVAATVKARHPTFTASAIKSAIMTTATQTNNMDAPITTSYGMAATPYDIGAGQLNPASALDPGLVYETRTEDYVTFLCATGYNTSQIRLISSTVPKHFRCPENPSSPEVSISNVNYPSIALSKLKKGETRTVTRTATNVGDDEDTVYIATVEAMAGIEVGVTPNKLVFSRERKEVSYSVTLTATASMEKDVFGSITWSNGKYNVRSPIVVSYAYLH